MVSFGDMLDFILHKYIKNTIYMKIEKEIRNFGNISNGEESRNIEGYAALYSSRSVNLGGFTEEITPGAFEGVIEKSVTLALIDHNQSRGILAKNSKGKGSLTLEADEKGLHFRFSAPETELGNELIEYLKRGDITQCSFAFSVADEHWEKTGEDEYVRHIDKIDRLYDVSAVFNPAYPETSIAMRSLEAFKSEIEKRAEEEQKTEIEHVEIPNTEEKPNEDEGTNKEDNSDSNRTSDTDTENAQEQEQVENPTEERKESPKTEDVEERNIINKEKENHNNITMKENKFSLLKTIRSIVNNQPIDDENLAVLEVGKSEMRKSGLSYSGQIQLPIEERAEIQATVTTAGEEVVETEKLNILEPLKNKLVFTQLGANYLTGLVGNISIPSYSGSTAGWSGEIESAQDGAGTFDSIEYAPKRITAYIDISKQFINQDSVGAEALIRRDIIDAVAQVLEGTILGDADATTKKPAGIFYGADKVEITYPTLVDMEKTLEEANVSGDFKYVVSPEIKAQMKTNTVGGTKSDFRFLLQGGEANGYPVVSTGNAKGIALANWSDLLVCQFGALDLTIDPFTQAAKGCIRLVVNAYFDAKFRRAESVVAGVLDNGSH